jgi:SAM-dependent methyltransferase
VSAGAGKVRRAPDVDPALERDVLHQFLLAHEDELRHWVANVAHAGSPARALALFDPVRTSDPLPPAKAHRSGSGYLTVPERVRGEPLHAFLERDPHPLPATADREGYHDERHFDYWLSGLEDFARVCATLERHGRTLAAPFALLDFGCASGRVLRHFLCQARGLELWGTDLNERHVDWLLRHFPRALKPFQCTALPSLPLADASLDLVTAFSVFTHIDEYELAWLLELRRLLKSNGIAYLTIHSDDTWGRLGPGMTAYDYLYALRDAIPGHVITPELFRSPMARDKTVFRWRTAELNNTSVFLSKRHVHEVWGRFFEVLEIVPQGSGYQDVVVLRKPAR